MGQAAKGGMGVVYRATDRQTGAQVAVKVMQGTDSDTQLRFEREATILASLDHPAIVRYVAHGTLPDGKPFLAMEWVEGETLQARLERTGLTIDETVAMGRRVAAALGYAHERGVIHRDIKPSNLILPERDLSRVAILDFGIARAPTAGSLTETGAMVGTPAYMSPEQARGERVLDASVDVFALGCVLYECLTGRRAFEGKHVLALIAKVVLWDPPRVHTVDPEIPEALDHALVMMLAKEAQRRPADGKVAASLLADVPPAAGPGKRSRAGAVETAVIRRVGSPAIDTGAPTLAAKSLVGGRLASIVVATPASAGEDEPIVAFDRKPDGTLIDTLRRIEPIAELLHDGSILAVVTDQPTPRELAERALRCARSLRRIVPDALIAVATGEIAEGDPVAATVETLLEDTVGALAREAMAMLFAGVTSTARPDGAIRIDERTAALLSDQVIRVKSACYVRGDR